MAKRIFDFFFSLAGLIILAPLFIIISLWIKIDSQGSVVFCQDRVGKLGKEFKIFKFRTMVENAESLGKQITVSGDSRITTCGSFLRKYKLDELPQLFNVLRGEMSLVGPRPEVPKYVRLYTSEQRQVLSVLPGITDLASIKFRNENEILAQAFDPEKVYIEQIMPNKLELNQAYIRQSSFFFDLYLILETLRRLVLP
jgi:lipopolysaccharide/colanic/teichoic acid biosynthesis glycosyltransferase